MIQENFQKTKLPLDQSVEKDHSGVAQLKHRFAEPDMRYWSQQLNFATWCATTGRGVSREIFDKDNSTLQLPPMVRSFFIFHVYFTVKRILFQLGGTNKKHALPLDPTFNQRNNPDDKAAYEFGIDFSSDFRYTKGSAILHNWAGRPHYERHPDDSAYNQYDWFCPNKVEGITNPGKARINQSFEAFVYCVLGSQKSILEDGSTQQQFLTLKEARGDL